MAPGTERVRGAYRVVKTLEGFHDAVRTPCALRADAMLDIFFFCVARYRKNPEK